MTHSHEETGLLIGKLGVKNQRLIGQCLHHHLFADARALRQLDSHLRTLFQHCKALGMEGYYIWHTQQDDRVRSSHAANHGKLFAWNRAPETGHPGQDINCRCWAQPVNVRRYAHQTLLTVINDNPNKWSTWDFVWRYMSGRGGEVTLAETGHLMAVIEHYATHAKAKDGTIGVYRAVERQVLVEAERIGDGSFTYFFDGTYNFQQDVSWSLGDSVVAGRFVGEVRRKDKFLVISGIVTYQFSDAFSDPESRVETLMEEEGITRAEAEARIGNSGDWLGVPYAIRDGWQTKFNGTIAVDDGEVK